MPKYLCMNMFWIFNTMHANQMDFHLKMTYFHYFFFHIYFRMFRTNTDSKCIFKKFKELKSDDELRVSETLEQHATGVMNVIDDTIMNIENVDYVFELLNSTGRKHITYEGFSQPFFWVSTDPPSKTCISYHFQITSGVKITIKLNEKIFLSQWHEQTVVSHLQTMWA